MSDVPKDESKLGTLGKEQRRFRSADFGAEILQTNDYWIQIATGDCVEGLIAARLVLVFFLPIEKEAKP